jgi:hypothetical protein
MIHYITVNNWRDMEEDGKVASLYNLS